VTSGIVTLVLLVVFLGIVIWAYSGRRKPDFDAAARIPLEDRDPDHSDGAKP
jgi:cytochrome c oxidase cbb3-type subunit 4